MILPHKAAPAFGTSSGASTLWPATRKVRPMPLTITMVEPMAVVTMLWQRRIVEAMRWGRRSGLRSALLGGFRGSIHGDSGRGVVMLTRDELADLVTIGIAAI